MIVARNPEDNFFYLYHIKPPKSWPQEKTTDLLFWCLEHLYFFTDSSHKCDEIPEEFIEAFIQQRSQGEAEMETPPPAAQQHQWEPPPSSWGVLTWYCKRCGSNTYNPSDKGTCYGVVAPDNERKMSLPCQLRCPKCQEQTCSKVFVDVPAGQDPRRVLVESLAGCSPLPQRLVFTCSHCGWTSE